MFEGRSFGYQTLLRTFRSTICSVIRSSAPRARAGNNMLPAFGCTLPVLTVSYAAPALFSPEQQRQRPVYGTTSSATNAPA
ncbi:hypothetical protein R1flu_019301 [Riccia fluitans]|uniref:Uncharacterized protein n=1 Tax=Riccia fluitans TaxID=41844 RepID=A0ABD1ZIA8_9MARC